MKKMMACAVMLGLAITVAGCGSSGGTSGAAASAGAPANAGATPTPGAVAAGSALPGATKTSPVVVVAGGTCKYLSDSDAATLASNAGAAKVTSAETTVASVTTCLWSGTTDHIYLVVTALNSSAPLTAMKAEMVASITETISGLGDVGGFVTKTATDVTVVFIKGSTQVSLIVSTTAANADAVAAAAKKIAAGL